MEQIDDVPVAYGFPSWKHQLSLAIWRNKPNFLVRHGKHVINIRKQILQNRTASSSKIDRIPSYDASLEMKSIEANQFAEQLTLIEWNIFRKNERKRIFFRLAWKSPERNEISPNIVALYDHFNRISYWTATEIVMQMDLKERGNILKKFIAIAERCLELGNYNTLLEILAGLNMAAIKRLKSTWANVPERLKSSLDKLNEIMSTASNYKNYREELSKRSLPVLPYLGIYLRDITFIEDGNTDTIKNAINYEKLCMLGNLFSDVSHFQESAYTTLLQSSPAIQHYILFAPNLPEEVIYIQSITCEPHEDSAH